MKTPTEISEEIIQHCKLQSLESQKEKWLKGCVAAAIQAERSAMEKLKSDDERIFQAFRKTVANHMERERVMREALQRIERWHGEFPDTGLIHDDGTPMSYGVAYGSNGQRDYMRSVARIALNPPRP